MALIYEKSPTERMLSYEFLRLPWNGPEHQQIKVPWSDEAVSHILTTENVQLICILGREAPFAQSFRDEWRDRLISSHVSFNAFGTLRAEPHEILEARVPHMYVGIHFVRAYEGIGPIISEVKIPIDPEATAAGIQDRIISIETMLFHEVMSSIVEYRVSIYEERCYVATKR